MVAENFTAQEAASKLCDREFCSQCDKHEIKTRLPLAKFITRNQLNKHDISGFRS